jgi:hypothetical protein
MRRRITFIRRRVTVLLDSAGLDVFVRVLGRHVVFLWTPTVGVRFYL